MLNTSSANSSRRTSEVQLCLNTQKQLLIFFFFFFFAFPSYISGVHHFWVRFLRM